MNKKLRILSIFALVATLTGMLVGCGDEQAWGTSPDQTQTVGSTTGPNLQLRLAAASTSVIPAGGQTTVTVTVVDANAGGALYATPVEVSFVSDCVRALTATIDSPATTANGFATVTYTNVGCTLATDVITAYATVDSNVLTASTKVSLVQFNPLLGSGDGLSFQTGVLAVTPTTIPAGSSAAVTATIVDGNNNKLLYTDPVNINFSSDCVKDGSTAATIDSPGTTANGTVTVTFHNVGCSRATDTITATATVNGKALTAAATVTIVQFNPLLGSGSGGTFTPGVLALGSNPISSNSSTSVTATIVDGNNNSALYTNPTNIAFSSACGATIDPSPAATVNGTALVTYSPGGCSSTTDTITASATVNGTPLSASATVNILVPVAAAVQYVSATPTEIFLAGTGLNSTSSIRFRVVDSGGKALPGQTVTFTPNTTQGGLTLQYPSAVTGADGTVTAVLNAGTYPTTVSVMATVVTSTGTTISASSPGIIIAVGLPHQNAMDLSATVFNPEGGSYTGKTVGLTVYASDNFQNPVPDGTTVLFSAEGGQVDPSCTTSGGHCSVTWTSAEPRPYPDGRATILAVMVGQESFYDADSDNKYDDGELFDDLGEAYVDWNENGVRDPIEPYREQDGDGNYDGPDGKYNGLLCDGPTMCGTSRTIENRRSLVLVMSRSTANFLVSKTALSVAVGSTTTTDEFGLTVVDRLPPETPQVMPAGTKISISTNNGVLVSPASYTVPSTNAAPLAPPDYTYTIKIRGDGTSSTGVLTITATTPSNVSTSTYIDVSD